MDLVTFIEGISDIIVRFGIAFVGIPLILIAGYKLMTSQGDPQKVKDAKEQIEGAVIGILFLLGSFLILSFILSSIFGVT